MDAKTVVQCVCELFHQWNMRTYVEYQLPNGRRLDVASLGHKGRLCGVEVKISEADFNRDLKWPDTMNQCFIFYFAVPVGFNITLIHPGIRVIHCDGTRAWIHRRMGQGLLRPDLGHTATGRYAVKPAPLAALLHDAPAGDAARGRRWAK